MFLTVLVSGKSKIEVLVDLIPVMTLFLTLLSYLLAVPPMVERERKHLLVPAFIFFSFFLVPLL